jgi:hypothetical protein
MKVDLVSQGKSSVIEYGLGDLVRIESREQLDGHYDGIIWY